MPSQVPIIDFVNGNVDLNKPGPVPMLVVYVARHISDNKYLICDHSGDNNSSIISIYISVVSVGLSVTLRTCDKCLLQTGNSSSRGRGSR